MNVPKELVERLGADRLRLMFAAWLQDLESGEQITKIGAEYSVRDGHAMNVRATREKSLG